MEFNASLMIGFVKRVNILDQEIRSTEGAMKHALRKWGDDRMELADQLSQSILKEVRSQQNQSAEAARTAALATEVMLREEREARDQAQKELIRCREKLAAVRTAGMGVLHQKELSGKDSDAQDSALTLEKLLNGDVDFAKLAVEVNELYRAGKKGKAQNAYAAFLAKTRAAENLLTQRINSINGEFAANMVKRHAELDKAGTESHEKVTARQREAAEALDHARSEWIARTRENADRSRFAKMELDMKRSERDMRIRGSFQMDYFPGELEEEYHLVRRSAPVKTGYTCPTAMPQRAYLGDMELSLAVGDQTWAFLNRYYPFLHRNGKIVMPCGVPFDQKLNSQISYTEAERSTAVKEAQEIALRLFMMTPAGKMRMTFTDPVSLGESFALFSRLVYDRDEDNVINGQIWASGLDIHRQLQRVIGHIADVTQRCLQGRYASLVEYNRDAFTPEGYHVLMLMDYPAGMSRESLDLLERIVHLGPKCGVFTILLRSAEQYQKASPECKKLIDQLDADFRKLKISAGGRVVFDGQKLPGQDIVLRTGTELTPAETDDVLTELRVGIHAD